MFLTFLESPSKKHIFNLNLPVLTQMHHPCNANLALIWNQLRTWLLGLSGETEGARHMNKFKYSRVNEVEYSTVMLKVGETGKNVEK